MLSSESSHLAGYYGSDASCVDQMSRGRGLRLVWEGPFDPVLCFCCFLIQEVVSDVRTEPVDVEMVMDYLRAERM